MAVKYLDAKRLQGTNAERLGSTTLLTWNTPLDNADQSAGILTKNLASSLFTDCCNSTSDAETYDAGTDYYFTYNGSVTSPPVLLVQIGLYQGLVTDVSQIKFGWNLTDAIKYIDQGATVATSLTPSATDTYHISIVSNTVKFIVKNASGSEIFTATSSTAFAGTDWSQNSTCYADNTWCSATQSADWSDLDTGSIYSETDTHKYYWWNGSSWGASG